MDVPTNFTVDGPFAADFISWADERYRATTSHIEKALRRRDQGKGAIKKGRIRYSDFRRIRAITAPAALVVAAGFDRGRTVTGGRISVFGYESWQPQVRKVLEQIGFFDILEVPIAHVGPVDPRTMRIARYESGDKLRQERLGQLVERLLDYIKIANPECFVGEDEAARTAQLFSALVEATENTRRHAYPDDVRADRTFFLIGG